MTNMKKELLKFARETIKSELEGNRININEDFKNEFSKKQACFVTLTNDGELRGCIGSLKACQELWKDIMENSINAAFRDPRFSPVTLKDLNKIKIEISILSQPKKLDFKNPEDLLNKLDNKMGIILKKGFYSSTFLPQVWEELPDKKDFLEHLSRKAGLSRDSWKDANYEFYRVESIRE